MHHRWTRPARAFSIIVGIAAVASCKGGDAGPTDPGTQTQTPTLSITVAPTSLDLNQGGTATATVTVTRGGGFAGAVALAVEGAPTGVAAANVTVEAGATTGTLNFNATANAAAALTNLTIRATGTGVTASAGLALTVKAVVVPTPAFTMALSSGSLSFAQGASANSTLTITRTGGFTGAVNLTATGAPAGVTVSFDQASIASGATTSTVKVASTSAAAVSSFTVTVHGSGTGVTEQTAALNVQVTAAPGGGSSGNTTWTFCGTSGLPLWVASQDGAGAWSRVTGASNAYSFNITSKGGIAYVVPTTAGFDLEIFYGTADELKQQGQDLCNGANTLGSTVNGAISGAGATDLILIGLNRSVGTAANSNTTYSIPNVPPGAFDLIAGKSTFTISGASVVFTPNKMFIKRTAPAGTTIDFGGADAFDPITKSITVNNLNGEESRTVMTYITASTRGNFYIDAAASAAATRNYFGVPAARQTATDFHYLNIIATAAGSLNPTSTRNAGIAFNAATDKQVTLGPALSIPTISSLGAGRTRTVFTTQPEYVRLFNADFQQVGATPRRTSIQMTGGYSGAGTITIDVPDFTAVSGFDTNWLLKVGTSATWTFIASGWQGAGVTSNAITDGATYLAATRMGTIGM